MRKRLIFIPILIVTVLCAMTVVAMAAEFKPPRQETVVTSNESAVVTQKNFFFPDGDFFWIRRYEFLQNSDHPYLSRFNIPGDNIEIRSVVMEDGKMVWKTDIPLENIPVGTLFISTDSYHMIIAIPAVYINVPEHGTLQAIPSHEKPIKITRTSGGYEIAMRFPRDQQYLGEVWALQSRNRLVNWNQAAEDLFLSHDLAYIKRFSMDGYYILSPTNYVPYTKNAYFRTPVTYSGGSFARTMGDNAVRDLGYVLMKTAVKNQNENGFYPTLPKSSWLESDFGIGHAFYDTRFNNDFAQNLIDAYNAYHDEEFLNAVIKYGEFYLWHAWENSYATGDGFLVSDYWHAEPYIKTHTSLNHHVDGISFLLKLFRLTGDDRYRDTALLMLKGIEETRDLWVREDGNLEYSLYYAGARTDMNDYPYLSYNDLYKARANLKHILGLESAALQYLMDSKLTWMIDNNITGYLK